MKKIIFILLVMLSINSYGYDQISFDTTKVEYTKKSKLEKRECKELPLGYGLMLSGTALIAMGNATEPYIPNQTFFKQGTKTYVIVSGTILLVTGFVLTVTGY